MKDRHDEKTTPERELPASHSSRWPSLETAVAYAGEAPASRSILSSVPVVSGIAVLAACVWSVGAVGAPSALKQKALPKNHDIWVAVGRCEQPGRGYRGINWSHRGDGGDGGYQGGLGFWHKSWDAFKPKGYPANAGDATWRQQMIVAQRLWDSVGWGWGCRP